MKQNNDNRPTNDSIVTKSSRYSTDRTTDGLISRHDAIKEAYPVSIDGEVFDVVQVETLMGLPSAQPERDIPKRVLWTGWKGQRDTRYKCPNCKKPVRNDDVYCHRCGQHLMFPHINWTPYVEGQKQELIVRWDDE